MQRNAVRRGRDLFHGELRGRVTRQSMHMPNFNLIKKFCQMKIIAWNVRGAGSMTFQNHFLDLCDIHKPSVVIVAETKIGEQVAVNLCRSLLFDGFEIVDAGGKKGELWLLWKQNEVRVNILSKVCSSDSRNYPGPSWDLSTNYY